MTNYERLLELLKVNGYDDCGLKGCDGIKCPKEFKGHACHGCPYEHFWQSEYKGWDGEEPTTKNDLGVDCIGRQAAITFVCKNTKEILKDTMPLEVKLSDDYLYENVAKIMRNPKVLPSVTPQEPRWIPVSERLPEENTWVLCWYEYFRYGDYECMQETYGVGFYDSYGHWGGDVSGHKSKAIAWMPLPKPYEPQESEERDGECK